MGKVASFKRILTDSVKPTAAVSRGRFVSSVGDQLTVANTRAYGVSTDSHSATDVTEGKRLNATVIGYEELEVGAATLAGALLTNDSSGRGVTGTTGQFVNAIGIDAGSALGDRVRALIIATSGRVVP